MRRVWIVAALVLAGCLGENENRPFKAGEVAIAVFSKNDHIYATIDDMFHEIPPGIAVRVGKDEAKGESDISVIILEGKYQGKAAKIGSYNLKRTQQ